MQYKQVLVSIGILAISFLAGIAFNYFISTKSKAEKKVEMDTLISFIINFVLFIWVGKIIVNISLVFSDFIVVLARPSDSKAFYVAVGLIIINVLYHKMKHNINVTEIVRSFLIVFIAASFMNEFIKIVILGNTNTWGYLTLLLLMLFLIVFIYDKVKGDYLIYIITATWIIGQFVLSMIFSQIVVFTYLISPVFLIVILVGLVIMIGYQRRKIVDG